MKQPSEGIGVCITRYGRPTHSFADSKSGRTHRVNIPPHSNSCDAKARQSTTISIIISAARALSCPALCIDCWSQAKSNTALKSTKIRLLFDYCDASYMRILPAIIEPEKSKCAGMRDRSEIVQDHNTKRRPFHCRSPTRHCPYTY